MGVCFNFDVCLVLNWISLFLFLQKVVLKLDLHDDKAKQKAMKTVSTLSGEMVFQIFNFMFLSRSWLVENCVVILLCQKEKSCDADYLQKGYLLLLEFFMVSLAIEKVIVIELLKVRIK